ncbi:hypothetical protein KVV02_000766 [Mortierella alpina]|uniref:Ankyrin n=1 Tax=Mortierella alpina TaxID=64518 RepID=A0A9P8AAS1_MORAP|nr:hypothetical protein KVV02_000766 [Mortierella alpina]
MAALRAMLQLRSNSHPASLPSQQLLVDTSDTQPTYTNHSTNTTTSSTSHPTTASNCHSISNASNQTSAIHSPPQTSSTQPSIQSLSTGSFHPGLHASSAAASPTPKPATPTKKPVPFQNLGLHSGSASGNLGLVKFALDNGQPIDSVLNGVYAIHAACCSNANVAVVLFLIERGADVNARRLPRKYSNEKGVQTVGTTGSTPLHFAAANGCLTVVDILLRHGAIVDMTDKYGSSPLSVAAARNHPEVASLLRQYSAMQRGVQDLTPDMDTKEPLLEKRGSADSGHRGTSPVTPTSRALPSGHGKDPSTQSLPPSTVRSVQNIRTPGQRRISLPSIIESPSSPNIPAAPRQSCDFGRVPQSTEPLVRSTASLRSTPSQPNRNVTLSPSRPDDRTFKPAREQLMAAPRIRKEQAGPARATMQRSHTSQGASGPYLTTPEVPAMRRRRSMESVGFLSPQSAHTITRRKSFDQISSLRQTEVKGRRTSDASTDSQATATSETSGTSDTSHSEQSPVSTTSSSSAARKPKSVVHLGERETRDSNKSNGSSKNSSSSTLPAPLTRSSSQPLLDQLKPKRAPVSFTADTVARQSLDLQRLVLNQERTEHRRSVEPRNDSDSDLPGQLLRRRTMQEVANPRLVPMPRYHSMRTGMDLGGSSSSSGFEDGSASSRSQEYHHYHHQQQQPAGASTSSSSGSLQEIAASRHSTSSLPSGYSNATTTTSAFSGSATVSGRLSRIWTGKEYAGKEGSAAGTWNAAEFGEASGEAAAQGLVKPDQSRSRASMLNRLSGIWLRR